MNICYERIFIQHSTYFSHIILIMIDDMPHESKYFDTSQTNYSKYRSHLRAGRDETQTHA